MFTNAVRKVGKGIKKFVDDKIKVVKDTLSSAQNRLILGLILIGAGVGVGGGLVASAYIKVPN